MDVQQLRELADGLQAPWALVGFFRAGGEGEKLFPLANLTATALIRGEIQPGRVSLANPDQLDPRHSVVEFNSTRTYTEAGGKRRRVPVTAQHVPAVYSPEEGKVYLGGPGWFFRDVKSLGRRCYSRSPEGAVSVGTIRDIFEQRDETGRALMPEVRFVDKKIIEQVGTMLREQQHASAGSGSKWGNKSIMKPTFYAVVPQHGFLHLRESPVLDDLVLHCARTGQWSCDLLPTLRAECCGVLTNENGTLAFKHRLSDEDAKEATEAGLAQTDVMPGEHALVHDNWLIEPVVTSEAALNSIDTLLRRVFGIGAAFELFPLITAGKSCRVGSGQAFFTPVPVKQWELAELKKVPDYKALQYFAALTRVESTDDDREVIDLTYAYGLDEPLAELPTYSFQKIEVTRGRQGCFVSSGPDHEIDLLNISRRVDFFEKHHRQKHKQASRPAHRPAIAATVPPVALPDRGADLVKVQETKTSAAV